MSARQLEDLGYSSSAIGRAANAGRLHRIHRGVYAVGHSRLTWHGRCLAAVLASEPAVAGHLSAAWLWGLLRNRPSTIHLTAPSRRHAKPRSGATRGADQLRPGRRPKPGYVVHFARLLPEDRDLIKEIPVTSLPRTLLDFAATHSASRLDHALERSEELGLFDLSPVQALLARSLGHPGAGRLRHALAIYRHEPAFLRSKFERRFLDLVRAAGLPPPSMNFQVGGFQLDAYWPAHRFAVELDVFATHGSRAAFERDRRRQEELKLIGIEIVRITDTRLEREPTATIARVGELLAQRSGTSAPRAII